LIHGGLRYLEHYEFRLVREALAERETLLKIAPHIVKPLKFTLPHRPHLRPAWMIRTGLFLYDHLSKRNSLPSAKSISLSTKHGMKKEITSGFEYYDCAVDDSRLVICNAISARALGAEIRTRQEVTHVEFQTNAKVWKIETYNHGTSTTETHYSKHVINAAGPWLNSVFSSAVQNVQASRNIRLIKGSHVIVPRVPNGDSAYILQNEDQRIVFVLPYQNDMSIIGTTDKEYQGSLNKIEIDKDEVEYLLNIHNLHFEHQLSHEDIVATYSGVRPLCDDESNDPSAITRDYTISKTEVSPQNTIISIYGGKITTYRKLANAVLNELDSYYPALISEWTQSTPIAGSSILGASSSDIEAKLREGYPWLPSALLARYTASYGDLAEHFLTGCRHTSDLGKDHGNGLYDKELRYLVEHEWASSAEDVLLRRTKLGYEYTSNEKEALSKRIEQLKHQITHPESTALAS